MHLGEEGEKLKHKEIMVYTKAMLVVNVTIEMDFRFKSLHHHESETD